MEKIEKGTIIEVNLPNVEKPIKAVVIPTFTYEGNFNNTIHYTYAQKRLFKMSNEWNE